jgi:hypothetical protein
VPLVVCLRAGTTTCNLSLLDFWGSGILVDGAGQLQWLFTLVLYVWVSTPMAYLGCLSHHATMGFQMEDTCIQHCGKLEIISHGLDALLKLTTQLCLW